MAVSKNKLLDNKGQAVFETMMFLPVLLFFVVYMTRTGNAINASINQQKATRGYTYYLLKGNSKANRSSDLSQFNSLNEVSAFIVGYRQDEFGGDQSVAPCFSLPKLPWIEATTETCTEVASVNPSDSAFIRVYTMYGVCGENYKRSDGGEFFSIEYPDMINDARMGCRFR